jgi:TolB-like protein
VLQALATRHAEQNEFEAAIEMARRAAAFDPLRETAHRTLMRLFDASGQSGLALRQYESCRDLLQRELAVRPDAETESLYQEIKQKRGAMAASATAATAAKAAVAADMTLPEKPSIAVLPFKNMRVPEEEYFADGISDNILTALSKFHWFFVIARDSSFLYRDVKVDARQVGVELGVRYVLKGSVHQEGKQVRISAQLIDGPGGHIIWAEIYKRELEDVFEVQDDITQCIVTAVAPQCAGFGWPGAMWCARTPIGHASTRATMKRRGVSWNRRLRAIPTAPGAIPVSPSAIPRMRFGAGARRASNRSWRRSRMPSAPSPSMTRTPRRLR